MSAPFSIYIFAPTPTVVAALQERLRGDRYQLTVLERLDDLEVAIAERAKGIDCLVLEVTAATRTLLEALQASGPLLPAILIDTATQPPPLYHPGEVCLYADRLDGLSASIERAVGQFLSLAEAERTNEDAHLTQKLRERLGYLCIYFKRNPAEYFRHLEPEARSQLRGELAISYRQVVLDYFKDDAKVNATIDRLAERAFFADLPITQIMEIHMELMEEFTQQLRLEGRNEEILLDYRLALIDVIAHLSEMYRRALPRERS